jgi:hypothetical protein
MLGLGVWDLNPRTSPQRYRDHFERLRREGTITFETFHRAKDGHMVPVEILASHVRIGDDERNCVFVRDISARKAHEAEMQAARAELECAPGRLRTAFWRVNRQACDSGECAVCRTVAHSSRVGDGRRSRADRPRRGTTDRPGGVCRQGAISCESQEELTDSVAFQDGRIFGASPHL